VIVLACQSSTSTININNKNNFEMKKFSIFGGRTLPEVLVGWA
jgi:hypothetical protein